MYVVAVLLLGFLHLVGSAGSPEQVIVDVYYESLCPDSQKFIVEQLYKAMQNEEFAKHVNLTFFPYGKSSFSFSSGYAFFCHHGPEECRGNKLHACAAAIIDGGANTPGYGFNRKNLEMVYCLMKDFKWISSSLVDFPVEQCARKSGGGHAEEITKCSNSSQGEQLLANVGTLTEALQDPPLTSVPTVILNKLRDPEKGALAVYNFTRAVCGELGEEVAANLQACRGVCGTVSRFVLLLAIAVPAVRRLLV